MIGERAVVVGGRGAVGGMFVSLLASAGARVCAVDPREPAGPSPASTVRFERADITDIGSRLADELGRADVVVLAVPESVALAAVEDVAAAMRPGALLVDTLSVKTAIAGVEAALSGIEVVSLNPMFAPSLDLAGRPVAAVVVHGGPCGAALLDLIGKHGGRVVTMTADAHDRLTAATQALTHAAVVAFGIALRALDVSAAELSAVAPPPHATMLGLLARICSGVPETYWDIQAANPHAHRARAALADGIARVAGLVDAADEARFAAALADLRGFLGDELEHHSEACTRAFAIQTYSQPPAE
ncbi:MAG TPA: prephenate dehydrogenase/arogenate dehydrogenase family protein [Streptosporangiaceae bacterium]|nr:prephenate dehydrogenase/arogenate dehydrogenase family protein [Streptosporangiaceae bacterium]